MKKYLMMSIAVLAASAAISSCSSDKNAYDETRILKSEEYANNFVKRYGEPSKTHSWGFATTRGVNANANQWSEKYIVPAEPTSEEIELVTNWFKGRTLSGNGSVVNWSDFFVHQISSDGYGKTNMDQLKCGPDKEHMEHMNNFNNGTCSDNGWHGRSMFMVNSGTKEFSFESSLGIRHTYYNFYCVDGADIDASLAGKFYVGYDFESTGDDADKQIAPDGDYSDWIVRIVPGLRKDAKRVICEDLGDTDDFDFNDVVFDAAIEYDRTIITIQAAGGTLPLTVGGVDVHEALGVGQSEMVNTGQKSVPVAIVSVPNNYNYNINNIPVVVKGSDATSYVLNAEVGAAPQKICVGTDYDWTTERQRVDAKYPKFKDYVGNESVEWYK